MKKVFLFSLILLLLSITGSFSQRQAFNIFWRRNGITFNSFCKEEINFLKLNFPPLIGLTYDTFTISGNYKNFYKLYLMPWFNGYSTISDVYGNLLFHTEGIRVYNREFKIMDNGDSLFWLSFNQVQTKLIPNFDNSAFISSKPIILPFPGDSTKYYLFLKTALPRNDGYGGFIFPFFVSYSIIDMTQNNGLGKVVEKKKFLSNDVFYYVDYIPILHKNEKDIWLLAVDRDGKIHNFLITKNGIEGGEIINDFGLNKKIYSSFNFIYNIKYLDYILTSPNGEKIAFLLQDDLGAPFWEIAKFDRETGKISQPIKIFDDTTNLKLIEDIYFSPNSQKLYLSLIEWQSLPGPTNIKVLQYELNNWDSISINSSRQIAYLDTLPYLPGNINLTFLPGVDGKVYLYLPIHDRAPDKLVILENPNEAPSSSSFLVTKIDTLPIYQEGNILSEDGQVHSYVFHSYLYRLIDYRKPACEGSELRFFFTPFFPQEILNQSGVEFEWSGPAGFYTKDTLPYIPNLGKENFGWYRVKIKTPTEELTDSVYVFREAGLKIKIDKSDDLVEGDSVRLYLDKRYSEIEWFDGTSDTSVVVRRTGKYWVCVVDTFCCRSCDTIFVKFLKPEEVTTVNLPDTSGVVGDANFCIPLSARKTIGRKLEGIKYKGEIRFDARAFAPKANYNSRIENGECVVDVEGEIADWESERKELERICGTILLSDKKKVPLKISRFEMEMNDTLFEPVKEDGSLQITGVCEPELSQIEYAPTVELREIHRTSRGRFEILLNATAEVEIRARVYNLLGEEIISESGIQLERGINAIELPIKLRSGVYLLVIESNLGSRKPYKFVVTE
jgi:hypothetical protein